MNATSPLSVVYTPSAAPRRDPQWNKARELLALGRRTAEAFAEEIERLREVYLLDKNANLHNLRRGKAPMSQSVTSGIGEGFVAQLEAQLGLHREQARRILDRVRYVRMLRAAAEGEAVKYITGSGAERSEKIFEPTEEARARARQLLDDVVAGDVKASAAWAGIVGEGRRVAQTGKKERAAVDHAMNISNAIAKLKTSLPHWRKIAPNERALLETEFQAIKSLLEGTLL